MRSLDNLEDSMAKLSICGEDNFGIGEKRNGFGGLGGDGAKGLAQSDRLKWIRPGNCGMFLGQSSFVENEPNLVFPVPNVSNRPEVLVKLEGSYDHGVEEVRLDDTERKELGFFGSDFDKQGKLIEESQSEKRLVDSYGAEFVSVMKSGNLLDLGKKLELTGFYEENNDTDEDQKIQKEARILEKVVVVDKQKSRKKKKKSVVNPDKDLP